MKLLQELYKTHVKKKLVEDINPNLPGVQGEEEDIWHPGNIKQEFTSHKTSRNQIPATFKQVDRLHGWKEGTVNLDIGGGRTFVVDGVDVHQFTVALRARNIRNLVFDPFNRTFDHNNAITAEVKKTGADTVTVNNVLNVIAEPQNRYRVIKQAYSALKNGPDNHAYFLIHEGDASGQGKETKDGYQNNMKTADYMTEIHVLFPRVFRKGKLIIAQK